MVQQQPDSALSLLKSILYPENLKESLFYQYALLQIQAKDKAYKDITEDTLIFTARDYYVKRKDFPNAALTAFYCGRLLFEQANMETAIAAYLEAEKYAGLVEDYNLKGLIQGNLSVLYSEQFLNKDAIIRGKSAAALYHKAGNHKNEISALLLAGDCFLMENKIDSAFYYYNQSLNLADYYQIPEVQAYTRQNISIAYRETGNYSHAKKNLLEALSFPVDSIEQARIWMNLAKVYMYENNLDSAKFYINHSLTLQTQEPALSRSTYWLLSDIEEKEGHLQEALHYFKEYNAYGEKILEENKTKAVLEIQEKYNYEKLKNENNRQTIRQQKTGFVFVFMLFCLSLIAFFFYRRSVRNEKLVLEAEQKVENFRKLAEKSLEKDNTVREILVHHLNILKKVALIDKDISEEDRKKGERFIKKINKIVYEQDALDWNKLYQAINKIQNNLYDRVREKYPQLNVAEFRLCFLSVGDFDDHEIAVIMKTSSHMVRKMRSAIRKKIGVAPYYNIHVFFCENLSIKE
jgi:tetratricopeptide (TPR) repeat protein